MQHDLIAFTCLPVQPEDSGRYTCVATNDVGQDSETITLTVHTHPAFTELLEDVSLNKGERLLLSCGVTGVPTPEITWVFNNNIIPGIFCLRGCCQYPEEGLMNEQCKCRVCGFIHSYTYFYP